MNYLTLINEFWRCNEVHAFTANEKALYFYLIKVANDFSFKVNPFWHPDGKTAEMVGFSVNNLKTARNKLKQSGLIEFQPGGKGRGVKAKYEILPPFRLLNLEPKVQPNIEPNIEPNITPNADLKSNLHLKEETKLNESKEEEKLKQKEKPKSRQPAKRFSPPSLDELIECFRERLPVDKKSKAVFEANRYLNYYESNGWKVGRNKMKSWKHAVNTWIGNIDGFSNQSSKQQNQVYTPPKKKLQYEG